MATDIFLVCVQSSLDFDKRLFYLFSHMVIS